ncbi:H+/Cl- antiporter ClcA [Abditibacterium utsteinense]|uniref:H+/Cl-antiporter ClcA n=1 Tax=Abditibacterium utsteinense TaxID=1960156 RepID=A0A2S8SSD8_9BACT|nr:voltage-gated chloride channel family protein [Abditibacterium utsteinense]PQV63723.1 H+/Cl- antiporter ClcA [Abditibacterium utsteinense]
MFLLPDTRKTLSTARYFLRWMWLLTPLSLLIGSACAGFLRGLDFVTQSRFSHPGLLWLLPFAGVLVAFCYEKLGKGTEAGNNLLLDAVHRADPENREKNQSDADSSPVVPRRMAPLILGGTLLTHLGGGSAGREGTAVQMGGALAFAWGRLFNLGREETRILLLCGIAAGFGGVFGTPLAGAIFALEVLAVGRLKTDALVPCLLAALVSNWCVAAWGVHHTHYAVAAFHSRANWPLDPLLALKIGLASIAFGLAATFFATLTHGAGRIFKSTFKNPLWRPFVGGCIVIALTILLGTRDYLGLGVTSPNLYAVTLTSAFEPGGAHAFSWAWKLIFTAVTLGSGFKGGEVTPLFFIGATLGNALSTPLHAPVSLMAATGFIAVFAGATNTPLACTLLGIELFGTSGAPYFALACFAAQLWSGHASIYSAQRRDVVAL